MTSTRAVMTPEQVAEYLQINKDTVYRYIREGKLIASRLGRSYRITRENLDFFLLANRTSRPSREDVFNQVMAVAESNKDVPYEQVEKDVDEAVKEVRAANWR